MPIPLEITKFLVDFVDIMQDELRKELPPRHTIDH
jgi:hypothetical protein